MDYHVAITKFFILPVGQIRWCSPPGMFHISNKATGVLNSLQFFECVVSMKNLIRVSLEYDIHVEMEYSGKSKMH